MQESPGQRGFFRHAGGGEQIGVAQLVGVFAEVAHFDPAFFGQGFEAVVDAAQADAHFFGQGALGNARPFLEQFEGPEVGVFVDDATAGGHFLSAEGRVLSAERIPVKPGAPWLPQALHALMCVGPGGRTLLNVQFRNGV